MQPSNVHPETMRKTQAANHKREFPSYTTEQLERALAENPPAGLNERLTNEIAARKAGISKPFVTPQIERAS